MNTRIIKSDGIEIEVIPENGEDFSLEEMQKIVGGYVEIIGCNDQNFVCILNEECKIQELPLNEKATALVNKIISPIDFIVGDVLVAELKYIQ